MYPDQKKGWLPRISWSAGKRLMRGSDSVFRRLSASSRTARCQASDGLERGNSWANSRTRSKLD